MNKFQKVFYSPQSEYAPIESNRSDRVRGVSYKDSQLDFISSLIINNAVVRSQAERIAEKLRVNGESYNVYQDVEDFINFCETFYHGTFERNNLDLWSKVRMLLVLNSRH